MRMSYRGGEIELHQGQDDWRWVAFDEEGEQIETGGEPDRQTALNAARRSARQNGAMAGWVAIVVMALAATFGVRRLYLR